MSDKVEAFLAMFSPIVAGRARKSLWRPVRSSRGIVTRYQLIEALDAEGWMLRAHLGQTDARLYAPDSETFYDAESLTTYGLSYAKFLGA
jgi:hypothetical protein